MKVAIICGAGIVSGKEIMALELGDGLRERGCSVAYATSLWGDGDFSNRLRTREVPFDRMRLGFISATLRPDCLWMTADQMARWPTLLYQYRRFIRRHQPTHAIHTNWQHALLLWPELSPARDLFWLHECVPGKPQYRALFTRLSRKVSCIVAVSEAVAGSLRRIGVSQGRIRVIHNGITDPSVAIRETTGARTGANIGIVGQVNPSKGHRDLLDAFAMVALQFPRAHLHVFGGETGAFAAVLKDKAKLLGVAERISWHGFVEDRSGIYSELDICVVPSRNDDPLPTTAIEAALFGLSVVATRMGGLPEIVADGQSGYLVEPGSPGELADRLARLLGDPVLRRRMGDAARRRAIRQFGRDRFIDDFQQLLDSSYPAAVPA